MGSGSSQLFSASTGALHIGDEFARAHPTERWTALVTGGNSGIGVNTCLALASAGATVFMCSRTTERGEAALADVRAQLVERVDDIDAEEAARRVRLLQLDLASLASVREAVATFTGLLDTEGRALPPFKLLVNNAGVMAIPEFRETADGFEMQWGTNHLGHFLLTTLLLDRLRANAPARVVTVSSSAHTMGNWPMTLPPERDSYSAWGAYGDSKLCNILFTRELNRRNAGTGVSAYSLHPGVIKTNLGQHLNPVMRGLFSLGQVFLKSIDQGASTSVYCSLYAPPVPSCAMDRAEETREDYGAARDAEAPDALSNYHADNNFAEPAKRGWSDDVAASLWETSERCVAGEAGGDAGEAAGAAAAGAGGDAAEPVEEPES